MCYVQVREVLYMGEVDERFGSLLAKAATSKGLCWL